MYLTTHKRRGIDWLDYSCYQWLLGLDHPSVAGIDCLDHPYLPDSMVSRWT